MTKQKYISIKRILIANRGEIAVRIMRTCRRMGIFTVAVFSDADENEKFVREADEAIRIGGFQPSESYLDQDKIIAAAKQCHADAIHPGYGFLSENASFSKRCADENIVFIGPNAEAIEAMGSKIRAKEIMTKAKVPVIPGYNGSKQDNSTLIKEAVKIGFPVLLKASAGGGGKGMRVVTHEKELEKSIQAAKREAKNAFGNDDLLIEKYFESSRHIEIQVFGDKHKNYIHLGERECSIQRRHQKIIEESPSPAISNETRNEMGKAAIKAVEAINYDNAGTVEFIYSGDGHFYFLEVNTRLQVEHPVTEMVTGLDLVEMQINIASGKVLSLDQAEIKFSGHSIECRLYAEDPANDFLPATGDILCWRAADIADVRYDSGIETGSKVGVFYDPMIAKIISYGNNREEAISKMSYALSQLELAGLTSNQNFLQQVIAHPNFNSGDFDTQFLSKAFTYIANPNESAKPQFLCAALMHDLLERRASRSILSELPSGWRNNFYQPQATKYIVDEEIEEIYYRYSGDIIEASVDGEDYKLTGSALSDNLLKLEINGVSRSFSVIAHDDWLYVHSSALGNFAIRRKPRFELAIAAEEIGSYNAPMPGQVIEVNVKPGDKVKKGETLLILLSMKMENAIEALEDGEVEEVFVGKDAFVEAENPLIKIKV